MGVAGAGEAEFRPTACPEAHRPPGLGVKRRGLGDTLAMGRVKDEPWVLGSCSWLGDAIL